jgi:hypothetical protein
MGVNGASSAIRTGRPERERYNIPMRVAMLSYHTRMNTSPT